MGQPAPDLARAVTLDDWAQLAEDDRRELVDGRLEEAEMPDWIHEEVVAWLIATLRAWVAPRGGRVAASGVRFAVADERGRMPDVSLFLPGRPSPPRRGVVHQPPDIAVEVASPTPRDVRRDRVEKVREYATFGIWQYWLLDPDARTLEILELMDDGCYRQRLGATGGQVAIPGCDGLVLDLDDIWGSIDQLGEESREG